jgi:hypothetical protein
LVETLEAGSPEGQNLKEAAAEILPSFRIRSEASNRGSL